MSTQIPRPYLTQIIMDSKLALASSAAALLLICQVSCVPLCRRPGEDARSVVIHNAVITPEVEMSDGNDSFVLYLRADWEVDLTGYSFNIPFDGIIVEFHVVGEDSAKNLIFPANPCLHSASGYLWVNSTDDPNCDATLIADQCKKEVSGFCLCSLSNCSVLVSRGCIDTLDVVTNTTLTVPAGVRSLRFPANFFVNYQISLSPYNREYANAEADVEPYIADDCIDLVGKKLSDLSAGRRLCCENGVPNILPYDVQQSDPVPVFGRYENNTKVNVTISWLPPDPLPEKGFLITAGSSSTLTPDGTTVINYTDPISNEACAEGPKYRYVKQLQFELTASHTITIRAIRNDSTMCNDGVCSISYDVNTKLSSDLCLKTYKLCDPLAECRNEFDPNSGRNATCYCPEGYAGDGLAQGTGCKDFNRCEGPNATVCKPASHCVDLPPPSLEAICPCDEGFYGDGLPEASGCTSITAVTLSIVLPVAFLLIIAVIIVVVVIKRRKYLQEQKEMIRFVTDLYTDEGILGYYKNPDEYEDKDTWQPTFGEKWEVNRQEIRFGDVLGRGNYGVVYKGWISKTEINNKKNEISDKDDRFFTLDVIKEDIYENEHLESNWKPYPVAIKCLQETVHSHENLHKFLAEISFMINVGCHENILQIYGCSTTQSPVFMVTEYMKYGDLLHFLMDAREGTKRDTDPIYKVTELSLSTMARDVAMGLSHLQQIRVIHGDIAARNVLVGENGKCKLSDFGLSSDVYRYGHVKQGFKEIVVPIKWISPERMTDGKYPITHKSDVWSYGNLLYEIFTLGCPPYPGIETAELSNLIKSGYRMSKPDSCSKQMYDIMTKCWRWRPSSRPEFPQIVKLLDDVIHSYIKTNPEVETPEKQINKEGTKIQTENGKEDMLNGMIFDNVPAINTVL